MRWAFSVRLGEGEEKFVGEGEGGYGCGCAA